MINARLPWSVNHINNHTMQQWKKNSNSWQKQNYVLEIKTTCQKPKHNCKKKKTTEEKKKEIKEMFQKTNVTSRDQTEMLKKWNVIRIQKR